MNFRFKTVIPLLVLIAVIGGIGWFVLLPPTQPPARGGRSAADDGPVPVLAKAVEKRDMAIEVESIGTVQALNSVTVRSEVDGRLIS